MAELAAHFTDHILPHLPVRQWVLSLPKRLRPYLYHNPEIAGAVLGIFLRAIRTMLGRTSPGASPDAQLGAVSFLHRFGSALNPQFSEPRFASFGGLADDPLDALRASPPGPLGSTSTWSSSTAQTRVCVLRFAESPRVLPRRLHSGKRNGPTGTTGRAEWTRLSHPHIVKVTGEDGYPAARASMGNPFVQQVIAASRSAADRAFGEGSLVLTPGLGGSLPLYLFTDLMGKPFVNVPVANEDDNQHGPDENLRIANLWYAIDLYAAFLTMPPRLLP